MTFACLSTREVEEAKSEVTSMEPSPGEARGNGVPGDGDEVGLPLHFPPHDFLDEVQVPGPP